MSRFSFLCCVMIFLSSMAYSQPVEIIDVDKVLFLISEKGEKIRVINFWATWCKPCVAEMPYFEAIGKNTEFNDVQIIFISLDFAEDVETKVKKFIRDKGISSTVMLLDNTDYNSWISRVDPAWNGAIPATLILNQADGRRIFFEKDFKEGELENILRDFKN